MEQASSIRYTPGVSARIKILQKLPFEDGNVRVGRTVAEKALAQSLGQATLTALAAAILSRRKSYYEALEAANKENEITRWLMWFAGVTIEAQRRTITLVEFLMDKTKLLDRLKAQLNRRQEKALLRMFREGRRFQRRTFSGQVQHDHRSLTRNDHPRSRGPGCQARIGARKVLIQRARHYYSGSQGHQRLNRSAVHRQVFHELRLYFGGQRRRFSLKIGGVSLHLDALFQSGEQ